ncbi:MAG: hypothetical protein WDN30_11995 [Pararobbsia sp.]
MTTVYWPTLTDDELDAIRKRAEQATPGPWISFIEGRNCRCGSDFIQTGSEDIELSGGPPADQDFIAHARMDVPRLLDEIRRLRVAPHA